MSDDPSPARILMLEDSPIDAELIAEHLRIGGVSHQIERVWTREDFIAALDRGGYDLVLADFTLPSFDGISALQIANEKGLMAPFILVSATLGEETAIEAMKKGATDFLVKDRLKRLPGAVKRAFEEAKEKAARRQAEERQRLLINELNHRVKNSLATVQAIAHQTLQGPDVSDAARSAFTDRLMALSRAHDILTEESWGSAELGDVIAGALAPYGGRDEERFTLEGPSVRLAPKVALSLAMALHELATNAAKYGALSVPEGCIDIAWSVAEVEGERRLRLCWAERDGPPVVPPSHKGFGSRLIERGLAAELQGEAQVAYATTGVVCTIDAPLPDAT